MAKTTQINKIIDGERNFAFQVFVEESGTTADLSDQAVVDRSALSPSPASLVITRVSGYSHGGGGKLEFDRNTDQGMIVIPDEEAFDFDYRARGANGWYDTQTDTATGTGDLVLTTDGIDTAGARLSLLVEGRKKFS